MTDSKGFKANPKELDGVADLSQLLYLEMPNVVHNLKCRYDDDNIYTGISSILIAVNPYKTMSCYGKGNMERFASKAKHAKAEPHVYNVAEDAYRTLVKSKDNQSMVVCGESGAGKSESAKHLMRHLAYTTSRASKTGSEESQKELEKKVLRILAANPILEAFGNAKTVLNNNSSRFGKFTKLLFAEDEKKGVHIVGSAIETFLLEKSRVNFQTTGERNYHIFYQIIAGLDDKTKARLGLEGGCRSFYYTSQSGCDTVEGIPDKDRFDEFMSSLTLAGFTDDEIDGILRIVAAILHMSNIKFRLDDKEVCHIEENTKPSLEKAADLLGVTAEAMTKCMCYRTLKIGGQVISKPYNMDTSIVNRDSMCKSMFSKMFDWVVDTINKVMYVGKTEQCMWIGILDVFGFECFAYNSFEQLCINLANERLQQFFNVHVIKSEQEEYEREAIYWQAVNVPDNQACLDMILKKTTGLLALLDSACNTPKATDETFTQILFKEYKKHLSIKQQRTLPGTKGRSKVRINGFIVRHYAKDVCYDAKEFLKKNVDSVHQDTMNLFSDTSVETAFKVMHGASQAASAETKSKPGKRGKGRKKNLSVGGGFAKQLRQLMKALESTRPFFIRCVKPNLAKKPNMWEDHLITAQLEAGGLIQALKIIKDGYPTRVGYKTIYSKYSQVLKEPPADLNERDFVEALIIAYKFNRSQFVLGLTKAFFKSDQQDFVTSLLNPTNALSDEIVDGIKKHLVHKKVVRSMAVIKAVARFRLIEIRKKTRSAVYAIQALARSAAAKHRLKNAQQAKAMEFKNSMAAVHDMPEDLKKIVEVVCTQCSNWISAVSSLEVPKGLNFLTSMATAEALLAALVVLGYPTTSFQNVTPASSGAKDNATDFIAGCKDLGVKKAQLCKVEDLYLLKRPLHALDSILNLCIATKRKTNMLPTVAFELSEANGNLPKGLPFLKEGGVLWNMSQDRKQELFNPGFIAEKRAKLKAEELAVEKAKKRKAKEEAKRKKDEAAAKKEAAAAAAEEAEAQKAKELEEKRKADEAQKAKEAAAAAAVAATTVVAATAATAATTAPDITKPEVKLEEKPQTSGSAPVKAKSGEAEESLGSLRSEVQEAQGQLEKAEKKLEETREKARTARSDTEVEKSQKELQEFIRKSKPFVSMLVTLLRKYSQTGMLEEVGLTWRDFPPMTLFETADKEGVEPNKWSEWIWDFVNDRIHTERLKKDFVIWFQTIKKGDGCLDLSYASITSSVMKELCKALIGNFRPQILSALQSGKRLERRRRAPKVKKGFFSSSKTEKKLEENLVSLKLPCNYVGPEAVPHLTDLITQIITIEELWLCGNPIGDKGVEYLCFGLQQAAQDDTQQQPFLNKIYLQSCAITMRGYEAMSKFLSTYEQPLVVYFNGNFFEGVPMIVCSKGARPYEKQAVTLSSIDGKLQNDLIAIVAKHYERILKNPTTKKFRDILVAHACRKCDSKEQEKAQPWWAANLLANGFQKDEKSKKGDAFKLDAQDKVSWDPIVWSLDFAKTFIDLSTHIESEALMFNLFHDLLIRVGTPYTGTIEKEHIFEELRGNPRVRKALRLNRVDFEKFQEKFETVDTKVKGGLMKVKAFVEYAAAFRHTLMQFQKIFGKYQDEKGEVEKQALYKAVRNDPNVRKFFGLQKYHYKQFNNLFQTISFSKKSIDLDDMVEFQVQEQNKMSSQKRRGSVKDLVANQVPPMQEPPRVVVRVSTQSQGYLTMAAFGDWTVTKLRPMIEQKIVGHGEQKPAEYHLKMEGKVVTDEDDTLWALAFKTLKHFPKLLTFELLVPEFKAGMYRMLVRTNMRQDISVKSDKIVTIEKGDLVQVTRIETDPETKAIRGLVEPPEDLKVDMRVLYTAEDLKKAISAKITSIEPLNVRFE